MKIKELEIENFRGIEKATIQFDERLTLLVAKNGGGKTTILEAIAIFFKWLNSSIDESKLMFLTLGENTKIGKEYEKLKIQTFVDGEFNYTLFNGGVAIDNNKELFFHDLKDKILNENKYLNLVYYSSNRYFNTFNFDFETSINLTDKYFQDLIKLNPLAEVSAYDDLVSWLYFRQVVENDITLNTQNFYTDKQFNVVKSVISNFIVYLSKINVRAYPPRVTLRKDDTELNLNQLSGGERNLLALVADIARRLAIANPDLENPLEGEGIVMIDEIELHLHPGWQRKVIHRLLDTFPNIQFIITTHSPQVIGEIKPDQIRILDMQTDNFTVTTPTMSKGLDSSMILEGIMGASERNAEVKEKLQYITNLIDEDKYAEAKIELNKLTDEIGGSIPETVSAETHIHLMEFEPESDTEE